MKAGRALTLDDREDELGLAEPSHTENVDGADQDANDRSVPSLVVQVRVPEGEQDSRGGDFDGNGDSVRVEVVPSWAI